MRVLLVHNRYRALGGEDTVFEAEARALREHGVEVFTEEFSNHDVPEDLGLLGSLRLAGTTIWSRDGARRVAERVREHQIDVVHFHNTFPLVSPAAYRAARRAGAAVVQTLHNYRPICANAMLMRDGGPCEDCLGRRVGWPGVVHACYQGSRAKTATIVAMQSIHGLAGTWHDEVDCYIALTEFQRQKYIEAGFPADRIVVKPNFVDFEVPPEPPERRGALFVGRLDEHKGLRVLFDAWEQIPEGHDLTVVGEGPLRAELEARAATMSGVRVLGWRKPDEVHRLMRAAKVVVVPSVWYEPFGLVAIEALACSTPVIASRVGALEEVVQAPQGVLVAPGQPGALAAAVVRTITATSWHVTLPHRFTKAENMSLLLSSYEAGARMRHRSGAS